MRLTIRARAFAPLALLLAFACSPTTDITRTSSEVFAGRTAYRILRTDAQDGLLRVRVRVDSLDAARTVAEDLVVRKRAGFDRVEVDVVGPGASDYGRPAGVLRWSTKNGFAYSGNR